MAPWIEAAGFGSLDFPFGRAFLTAGVRVG